VAPAKNEREKARSIFRWVTENIDYDVLGYFAGSFEDTRSKDVLKSRKSVCGGYSDIFSSLANSAGLDMVHVPYKGAGPAITDLVGGRLDFMITTLPSVVGFLDSGKAKPLAVTTPERAKQLPEVPTIAESGYPDYQTAGWYGFAVPKGTPPEVVTKQRDATVAATQSPDVQKSLDIEGAVVIGSTPEEFGAFMQSESQRWAELIATTGLTTD
jgi:tripartite-type tricarboxylate transporter receptor subunit TctC